MLETLAVAQTPSRRSFCAPGWCLRKRLGTPSELSLFTSLHKTRNIPSHHRISSIFLLQHDHPLSTSLVTNLHPRFPSRAWLDRLHQPSTSGSSAKQSSPCQSYWTVRHLSWFLRLGVSFVIARDSYLSRTRVTSCVAHLLFPILASCLHNPSSRRDYRLCHHLFEPPILTRLEKIFSSSLRREVSLFVPQFCPIAQSRCPLPLAPRAFFFPQSSSRSLPPLTSPYLLVLPRSLTITHQVRQVIG